MKRVMGTILMTSLIVFVLLSHTAWAAGSTKLYKIRLGQHPGFTRLVFDTEGARPLRIGPADADEVNVVYEQLNFEAPPDRLFRNLRGAVTRVSHQRLVITSYSIHYTKLYDAEKSGDRRIDRQN